MQYFADPLSRLDIRRMANSIREVVGVTDKFYFPIISFLELFPLLIGDENFYYEIVEDHELPDDIHAHYDVDGNCIRIKQHVYDGAVNGNGRDRMTIAHELAHVLLIKVSKVRLHRQFTDRIMKRYEDPEWQAKCFAGELLVPARLVKGMAAAEVAGKCGVSEDAARIQLRSIK